MPSARAKTDRLWTLLVLLAVLMITVLLVAGCRKDESDPAPSGGSGSTAGTTRVLGQVVDGSGTPLPGVLVQSGSLSAISDAVGVFVISGAPADHRVVVRCKKTGYFDAVHGAAALLNGTTIMRVAMRSSAPDFTGLSSASPQDLQSPDGFRLQLPANGLVTSTGSPYSGTYAVAVEHFATDAPDFSAAMPGGDLTAVVGGTQQQLYSYGMASVRITDPAGTELQLGNGAAATLHLPIAANQSSEAPATVPLWHLNEQTGIWEQEGEAQRIGGEYVGTVQHFSTWNVDAAWPRARLRGYLIPAAPGGGTTEEEDELAPLLPIRVRQVRFFPRSNGEFDVFVPSGIDLIAELEPNPMGVTAAPVPIGILAADEEQYVELVVNTPGYIVGTINCPSGSVNGYAMVTWSGGSYFMPLGATPQFRIAAPYNGEQATLRLVNLNGGITQEVSVTLPTAPGGETDAGTITLCSGGSGSGLQAGCVLNGDGYDQQTVVINPAAGLATATYYAADNSTQIFIVDGGGGPQLYGEWLGSTTGNCATVEGEGDCGITLVIDGRYYFPHDLQVGVNQYGPVGGDVQGFFLGTMVRFDTGTGEEHFVNVSNGFFRVQRAPDEP
ncbi:MAG TPA: carboxypeptidase-like regulatory domain-containing protein [Flavobacteriales bacterium]|nr:carboxypeptidase-like regulatory domain-containing protein [Flavobacteriales bacterium]